MSSGREEPTNETKAPPSNGLPTDPPVNYNNTAGEDSGGDGGGTGRIILFEDNKPFQGIGSARTTVVRASSTVTEAAVKITNAVEDTRSSFHSRVTEGAKAASNDVLKQNDAVNAAAAAAIESIREAAKKFTDITKMASEAILAAGHTLSQETQTTSKSFSSEVQEVTKKATELMIRETTATLKSGSVRVKVTLIPD